MVIDFWYALELSLGLRRSGNHHHDGGSKILPRSMPAILDDSGPLLGRADTETVAARAGTRRAPARMIYRGGRGEDSSEVHRTIAIPFIRIKNSQCKLPRWMETMW